MDGKHQFVLCLTSSNFDADMVWVHICHSTPSMLMWCEVRWFHSGSRRDLLPLCSCFTFLITSNPAQCELSLWREQPWSPTHCYPAHDCPLLPPRCRLQGVFTNPEIQPSATPWLSSIHTLPWHFLLLYIQSLKVQIILWLPLLPSLNHLV